MTEYKKGDRVRRNAAYYKKYPHHDANQTAVIIDPSWSETDVDVLLPNGTCRNWSKMWFELDPAFAKSEAKSPTYWVLKHADGEYLASIPCAESGYFVGTRNNAHAVRFHSRVAADASCINLKDGYGFNDGSLSVVRVTPKVAA